MTDPVEKLPTKEEIFVLRQTLFFGPVNLTENEINLTLVEARSSISNAVQESFSLLFRAPADAVPCRTCLVSLMKI